MSARAGNRPGVNLTDPRVLAQLGTTEQGQRVLALLARRDQLAPDQTRARRHLLRSARRAARRALNA